MTTRHRNQSERRSTAELDPVSLEGLLEGEGERDPKPTTVMRRDDLLELVHATTPPASVSAHAVPRVLLEQRQRDASDQSQPIQVDYELNSGVSPLVVLAIIGILIGMFAAIVLTT